MEVPLGSTHRRHHGLVAVADRQRRRRAELVGEDAELSHRHLLQARADGARELEQAQAERVAPVGSADDEAMGDERAEQPVDARPVRVELRRELGDGEPVRVAGQHAEHVEPAIERL